MISKLNLQNKKLMILGGNPETRVLVDIANKMGIYTIVVDPNPMAPAKKIADESYEYDGFDIEQIVLLAKDKKVDGVLVGVADILVAPYQVICDILQLPCYATNDIIKAFCSKDGFKLACEKYGVKDIPGYYINDISNIDNIPNLEFPLMVKPVDNGAGVGMRICHDINELKKSISNALKFSKKGGVLVEEFMNCDDIFAYYTFKDGKAFLSALADRITTKKQGNLSPVCIGAIYPSKYANQFINNVNPLMLSFFEKLGIRDGVLNIQFFVKDDQYYAYDPGFRLQGEAPHIHISEINKFDHRKMLINFALTGSLGVDDFNEKNDYLFKNRYAATIWVLLKSGTIANVKGLDVIKSDKNVSFVMERFFENDIIEPNMIGTERQVFARIYLQCNQFEELKEKVIEFQQILEIKDSNGENMIIDWVSPASVMNYKLN
jgi:biotin carboxylase